MEEGLEAGVGPRTAGQPAGPRGSSQVEDGGLPWSEGSTEQLSPRGPETEASLFLQPRGTSRELDFEPRENASKIPSAFSPPSTEHLFIDMGICMEKGLEGNTQHGNVFFFVSLLVLSYQSQDKKKRYF